MKKELFLFGIVLLCFYVPCRGQNSIQTDRPDQTETSSLVPKGRFQGEFGVAHEQTDSHFREYSLPTSLLKFGVSQWAEVRIGFTLTDERSEEGRSYGLEPLTIGTKIKLLGEKGIRPSVSLLAEVSLPDVASEAFKLDHLAPEVRLLMQNKLSKSSNLGYNLGARFDGFSSQPEYLYTLSPSYSLTKELRVFAETYGFLHTGHHAEQWVDGGFSFLISADLQVDISGGYELTHTGNYHNFFESVGVSFRI